MDFKAAVIGMGGISPMHVKSIVASGVKIVAVCDKNKETAERFAGEIGCLAFTCFEEMFKHSGFDVVHICLPHFLHAPVSIKAMESGYHVMCEKPMATSVEDAAKMIETSKKTGKTLGIIFQNRYNPGSVLVKEVIEKGELGKIISGEFNVKWNRFGEYYSASDWRGKWATEGGGVLVNQSIHTFDLMNFFLGDPTTVNASVRNMEHPEIEVDDLSVGVITYGDIPVEFFVNTFHATDAPVYVKVVGEKGTATLVGDDGEVVFADGTKKTAGADFEAQKQFGMKDYWGTSHIKQVKAFYDSLEAGEPPFVTMEDAFRTQRLLRCIYESAKENSIVNFK